MSQTKSAESCKSTGGKLPLRRNRYSRELIRENVELVSIMLPTLALIFIFLYIPMYGVAYRFPELCARPAIPVF